jgi:hypothetical protein
MNCASENEKVKTFNPTQYFVPWRDGTGARGTSPAEFDEKREQWLVKLIGGAEAGRPTRLDMGTLRELLILVYVQQKGVR